MRGFMQITVMRHSHTDYPYPLLKLSFYHKTSLMDIFPIATSRLYSSLDVSFPGHPTDEFSLLASFANFLLPVRA